MIEYQRPFRYHQDIMDELLKTEPKGSLHYVEILNADDEVFATVRWDHAEELVKLLNGTPYEVARRFCFNTERSYTEHGQRIAAQEIDGGVYMVDIDRNLAGFYPCVKPTQRDLMASYDANMPRVEHSPPSMDPNNRETPGHYSDKLKAYRKLRDELEELARCAPSLKPC